MDEQLIAKIKNLSNLENCWSAEDMQDSLEKIHDLLQENYPDNIEITQEDIEKGLEKQEQIGKEINEYLEQYKGTPTYSEVALAMEFAVKLKDKYDI